MSVFTDTIMNIFENFIQHKTITCDEIKALLKQKHTLYKHLLRKTLNASFSEKFIALQSKLQNSIKLSKTEYYKKTLQNDLTNYHVQSVTGLTVKESPVFPFFHDNKFVAFFANQCSLIDNGSKLPLLSHFITDKSISKFQLSPNYLRNIRKSDSNKAHRDNVISICACSNYVINLHENIIFSFCLTWAIFPSEWKKANLVSLPKIMTKTTVLSPSCQYATKFLNAIFIDTMFSYLSQNNLM